MYFVPVRFWLQLSATYTIWQKFTIPVTPGYRNSKFVPHVLVLAGAGLKMVASSGLKEVII